MEAAVEKVNSLRLSKDSKYLVAGTSWGYRVYTLRPTKLILKKEVPNGVKLVIPCPNERIITYLEDKSTEEGKEKTGERLVIYDHSNEGEELYHLKFSKKVIDVKYINFTLIVVQEHIVKIIKFSDFKNPKVIETAENPYGAVGINRYLETDKDDVKHLQLIACPGTESDADVFVTDIENDTRYSFFPGYATNKYVVTALELNSSGSLLAAATTEGKSIDIFDVQNMAKLYSLSRGRFPKHIDFLSFQQYDRELIVSAIDGAVHLFSLLTEKEIQDQEEGSTMLTAAFKLAFTTTSGVKFRVNNEQSEIDSDSDNRYIS
mmetsp:Transcript_2513/g.2360  ORF Transcript_2513/g.2360 Transcript_2513/m.2360 type:complete len:319 (+) Transcript_2513:42-998(+)